MKVPFLLSGFKEKIKSFSLTLTLATPWKIAGHMTGKVMCIFLYVCCL